jgi:hypothetical protein
LLPEGVRKMKAVLGCLIGVLVLAGAASVLVAQEKPADKPATEGKGKEKEKEEEKEKGPSPEVMLEAMKYFPMEKGNWWEYKFKMDAGEEMPPMPMDEDEMKQKLTITEVTKNGCKMDTTRAMLGMLPSELKIEKGFLLQTVEGAQGQFRMLKLPPKKGEKWKSSIGGNPADPNMKVEMEHTVAGMESVKTPAGEFQNAVKVVTVYKLPAGMMGPGDDDDTNMQVTITMWFAPGVGIVKMLAAAPMAAMTQELSKFQVKPGGERLITIAAQVSELVVIASVKAKKPPEFFDEEGKKRIEEEAKKRAAERKAKIAKGETVDTSMVVEKVLKGKLDHKEIVVAAAQEIAEGKWVLFLGKLKKEGYPLIGPTLPAQDEIVRKVDSVLNPPKPITLKEALSKADLVIVGKAVVKEERENYTYWVFKVEKTLKGENASEHVDVLFKEGLSFTADERYMLALRASERHGRKFQEVLGEKTEAYSEKKLEEYKKILKK